MPTQKKRVAVVLEPSQEIILNKLAEHLNVSVAAVIKELIIIAMPGLERIASLHEELRKAKSEEKAKFLDALDPENYARSRSEGTLSKFMEEAERMSVDIQKRSAALKTMAKGNAMDKKNSGSK
jgi:hypothetical protein